MECACITSSMVRRTGRQWCWCTASLPNISSTGWAPDGRRRWSTLAIVWSASTAAAMARATNDLEALAACMEGLGHSPAFDRARLAAITTPILLAVGERDEIAHDAAQLAVQIPTARLVVIPARDHMGAVPARQFKDAAVEFLAET